MAAQASGTLNARPLNRVRLDGSIATASPTPTPTPTGPPTRNAGGSLKWTPSLSRFGRVRPRF